MKYIQKHIVDFDQIEDEYIGYIEELESTVFLNEVGYFIYNVCINASKEEIIQKLIAEYNVDRLEAAKDVTDYLELLCKNALICEIQ